jgi:uncharacterized protein (DUF58 family)
LRVSRLELARLNHILIPETRERRDQFRASPIGRMVIPVARILESLTFEGAALAVLLFFMGLFVFHVELSSAHVVWGMAWGYLISALVFSRRDRLDAFEFEVRLPERIPAGETISFQLRLRNPGLGPLGAIRISLPFLPWDGKWLTRPLQPTSLPALGELSLECTARFEARGLHDLDPISLSLRGFGGLTSGVPLESGPIRFLVTPRETPIQPLDVGFLRECARRGDGIAGLRPGARDFRSLRSYQSGDPIRDLHAKTWARLGKPVILERENQSRSRVGLVVDLAGAGLDSWDLERLLASAMGALAELGRLGLVCELLLLGVADPRLAFAENPAQAELLLALVRVSDLAGEPAGYAPESAVCSWSGMLEISAADGESVRLRTIRSLAASVGIPITQVHPRVWK